MGNIPNGEVTRAQNMLSDLATKLKFGPGKPPRPFIIAVARELGGNWGLNGKRGNASDISGDVLSYRIPGHAPANVDVILDGGGKNRIVWQELAYKDPDPNALWVDPFSGATPDPAGDAPDTPGSDDGGGGWDTSDPDAHYPTGGVLDQLKEEIYPQLFVDGMSNTYANRVWSGIARTMHWVLRFAEANNKEKASTTTVDQKTYEDVEVPPDEL